MAKNYKQNRRKSVPQQRKSGKLLTKHNQTHNDRNDAPESTYNDVGWYAPSAQFLKDAGRFSFNNRTGAFLDFASNYYGSLMDFTRSSTTVPGLMAFRTVTCPGLSKDNTSAVNRSISNIYSIIRRSRSGTLPYDAPDLGAILLAADSLYYMHAHIRRAYGVAMTYSARNLYYPRAVVQAMGFDYDDFRRNLTNYRNLLNHLMVQINTIYIPASFPWYVRHSWLFSNIYLDSDSDKAQSYMFVPHGYYTYEEVLVEEEPAVLRYHEFMKYDEEGNELLYTFEDIDSLMHDLVDKLRSAEDLWTITGDVLKAFEGGLFRLEETTDDYSVVPVYNPEVLMQIHNMNMVGSDNISGNYNSSAVDKLNITQDVNSNALKWNPQLTTKCPGLLCDKIINFHAADPTPAMLMEATRLTACFNVETSAGEKQVGFNFYSLGSEFVNEARIYYHARESRYGEAYIAQMKLCSRGVKGGAWDHIHEVATLSKFKDAPQFTIFVWESDGTVTYSDVFMELDNYNTLTSKDLADLHDTAIMGLFGIRA